MTSTQFFTAADRYDRLMGPIFFTPTATAVAERIASMLDVAEPAILEVAAGTGQLTQALCRTFPAATVTATDLNPPMLEYAKVRRGLAGVRWQHGDAHELPFGDGSFDLIVSQFGVMFFGNRGRALSEAARLLTPGGLYVQTSWDVLRPGDIDAAACRAFASLSPKASQILSGVIHGYHNPAVISYDLTNAGLADVTYDVLEVATTTTPDQAGTALAKGSALHAVFTADGIDLDHAAKEAAVEIARSRGIGENDTLTSTLRVVMASGRR